MRQAVASVRRRIGRRGSALLFLGLVDFVYCYRLLFPRQSDRESPWLTFLADFAPLWVWAGMWGTVGLLCVLRSFRRRDSAAFSAAIGIKILWTGLAIASGLAGVDQWYINAVIWGGFAAFVGIVATWPEPPNGWKEHSWQPPT
jgi:hypothetical protein